MQTVKFDSEQLIFKEGDAADRMYKVMKGSVKIVGASGTQDEAELAILNKGAYFGEMGVIEGAPRSASASAYGKAELLEIEAGSFESFIGANPTDAIDIMRNLSGKLRKTTKSYVDVSKLVSRLIDTGDASKANVSAWKKLKEFAEKAKLFYMNSSAADMEINKKTDYLPGEIIFRRGQRSGVMFKLLEGEVGIYLNYGMSDEKQLTVLTAGAVFGEMGVIENENRSADAVAKTAVKLMPIANVNLVDFVSSYPADAIKVMRNISASLRATTQDYLNACKDVGEFLRANRSAVGDQALYSSLNYYADVYNDFAALPFVQNNVAPYDCFYHYMIL